MERWGGRCLPLADLLFTLAITVDEVGLVWTLAENWCGPGGVAVLLTRGDRLYVGIGADADCVTERNDHSFEIDSLNHWAPTDRHFGLTPLGRAETIVRGARWIRRREHDTLPIVPLVDTVRVRSDPRAAPLIDRVDAFYRAAESEMAGRTLDNMDALAAAEHRRSLRNPDAFARARAVRQRLVTIHSNDRVFGL